MRYPDFNNFNPKSYKKYFPTLTENEIQNNSEAILNYFEKIQAFEISSIFSQTEGKNFYFENQKGSKSGKMNIRIGFLNEVCTVAVIIAHPRLDISGLQFACDQALTLSSTYGNPTTAGGSSDRMDAIRHGIWGTLMGKHGCWRYSDKGNASMIVRELLNAHECGTGSGLDTKMDLRNNEVSISYYYNNASRTGSWPNYNTRIHKTDETITQEISAMEVVLVTTEAQMWSTSITKLIRIN